MSYALHNFDVSEVVTPRVVKRAPVNTNPLQLTSAERSALAKITAQLEAKLAIQGLSTTHQVRATYAAIVGIEAIVSDNNINAAVQTAVLGFQALAEVQGVSPYIFSKQDEAKRNLVSDERIALKDLALRLAHAARPKSKADADRAMCLRALVCAAIAAERGLVHLAYENFGAIIRTVSHEECELRSQITWTDELSVLARRWRLATVKMP